MSRAFIKEDVEIVERATRRRSTSGLPPGALNYLTAQGAQQLRGRLRQLEAAAQKDDAEISHLELTLASATIVEPQPQADTATFGASVTLQNRNGQLQTYRIVGVDEVQVEPGNVSWVSPLGKALLGAEIGQRIMLPDEQKEVWTVSKIA
jgi:transcription elongation factor GreB